MIRARAAALIIMLNAVLLVVALGLVELGLSWYEAPASVRYSVYPPNQTIAVTVNPGVTPGVRDDAVYEINALGTRGPLPSPDDDLRILALGGSTTECFVLSLEESWPFRVGQLLGGAAGRKVWVGNIGRAGRHSRQHYFDAKYVVPELGRAHLALLMIGINDQFNRMVQGEAFETQDVLALDREGSYMSTALHVGEAQGGWLARRHLARRGRRALEWLKLLSPREREIRWMLSQTLPDFYVNGRAMRAARGATIETLPPMQEPIAEFERNLGLIIARLREHGTEPVLITQPSMWRDDLTGEEAGLLWLGSADGWPPNRDAGAYYSVGAMAAMLRLYNDALRNIARSEGISLIDLAVLVTPDTTTFYDDVHFNESGAERAARVIAGALRDGPARSLLGAR